MNCLNCTGPTIVTHTKRHGNGIRRIRRCNNCSTQFSTMEMRCGVPLANMPENIEQENIPTQPNVDWSAYHAAPPEDNRQVPPVPNLTCPKCNSRMLTKSSMRTDNNTYVRRIVCKNDLCKLGAYAETDIETGQVKVTPKPPRQW